MLIGEEEIRRLLNEQKRLRERVQGLLVSNNEELERRRLAESEARRCRKALARVKYAGDKLGHIPWSVMDQIVEPALAGHDGPELWEPKGTPA